MRDGFVAITFFLADGEKLLAVRLGLGSEKSTTNQSEKDWPEFHAGDGIPKPAKKNGSGCAEPLNGTWCTALCPTLMLVGRGLQVKLLCGEIISAFSPR